MPGRKGIFLGSILLCCLLLTGCIKRNIHIISSPPGATVYFNEEEVGQTPLDYDFIHYAVHKVEIKKEGYASLTVLENLKPPIYGYIPIDFFFEIIPRDFWDRKERSYTLTPLPASE